MKIPLTKIVIDEALARKRRVCLCDIAVSGFYVEIRANGTGSYLLRYTHPLNGRQFITLGPVGIISLDDARQKARELLNQVYLGVDPAEHKRQQKAAITLQELVDQRYLPHAKAHKKSWDCDDSLLRNHILPALGTYKLTEITSEHITTLHLKMAEQGLAPATCNRVVVLLKHVFNLAMKQWKIAGLKENPANTVTLFKVNNQQQTFLEPAQLATLLNECRKVQQNPHLPYIIALLSLTGVRRGNALKARWCEFDESNQTWTIPVTKNGKAQTIQLSNEVIQLLQVLPSRGQSEWLFPNPQTGKPLTAIFYSWDTARNKAGLPHVRIHDLRHTFASLLINAGHSLYVVQKALGHYSPTVTMRYAHLADAILREANNAVGSLVKSSVSSLLTPPSST